MNSQVIEFVALSERRMKFDYTQAYELRTDRPAVWLQRTCFWILRKLRAFYVVEKVTIERHQLDAQAFIERLFKQRKEIERFFNVRPSRLLIGAEDYADLMHEVAATQMFSFRAEYGHGREILGMKVEVIPWMRGVLVMP